MDPSQVIISPINTEKATALAAEDNQYLFKVHKKANKVMIKQAIKKLYGIDVEKVRTMTESPKTRVIGRGRVMTKRRENKKAIITTKKPLDFNNFK